MTSVSTLRDAIGQQGTIVLHQLTIPVIIRDARVVYNRTDYLVTPLAGLGQTWIAASAVDLPEVTR